MTFAILQRTSPPHLLHLYSLLDPTSPPPLLNLYSLVDAPVAHLIPVNLMYKINICTMLSIITQRKHGGRSPKMGANGVCVTIRAPELSGSVAGVRAAGCPRAGGHGSGDDESPGVHGRGARGGEGLRVKRARALAAREATQFSIGFNGTTVYSQSHAPPHPPLCQSQISPRPCPTNPQCTHAPSPSLS